MAILNRIKTFIILILLVCLFAHFNNGTLSKGKDWIYYLPAGYEVWHINAHEIILNKRTQDGQLLTVLDQFILEFGYNYNYIGVKQVNIPRNINSDVDGSIPSYYIIEANSGNISGPMDEIEFNATISKNNIAWDVWKYTK